METTRQECPIDVCIDLIKGKCKAALLLEIKAGRNRFGIMRRVLDISERMLAKQLDELQKSGLISRMVVPGIPLHVQYALTPQGETLYPVVQAMLTWGKQYHTNTQLHSDRQAANQP